MIMVVFSSFVLDLMTFAHIFIYDVLEINISSA